MNTTHPSAFAALIGIDWADKTHAVCMILPGQHTIEETALAHRPEDIDIWVQTLRQRFGKKKIAIALEQRKGPPLIAQLRTVLDNIAAFDQAIGAISENLPDTRLFDCLPGAGAPFAPRLLAAFGQDRSRYGSANDLLQYSGIAPVTEQSGNTCWIHWRLRCPKFLRQTFIEWAGESVKHSFWAKAYYRMQRDRGKSHQVALRALAFKWIRILFRCWKDHTPYDDATYLMALQDRGSPLLQYLAQTQKKLDVPLRA
jgi:transposase